MAVMLRKVLSLDSCLLLSFAFLQSSVKDGLHAEKRRFGASDATAGSSGRTGSWLARSVPCRFHRKRETTKQKISTSAHDRCVSSIRFVFSLFNFSFILRPYGKGKVWEMTWGGGAFLKADVISE